MRTFTLTLLCVAVFPSPSQAGPGGRGYRAPTPTYRPPAYRAPVPTYRPPAYRAPTPSYRPPTYRAPAPTYRAPAYRAPSNRPNSTYRAPATRRAPAFRLNPRPGNNSRPNNPPRTNRATRSNLGVRDRMLKYRSGTKGLTPSTRQRLSRLSSSVIGNKSFFKSNPRKSAFQDHHLIPHQHQGHHVLKMASRSGFHINSRSNKMLLPTTSQIRQQDYRRNIVKRLRPSEIPKQWAARRDRSVHNGFDSVHKQRNDHWARKLDKVAAVGKRNNWTPRQYHAAVTKMLARERQGLRAGRINVNRDKR